MTEINIMYPLHLVCFFFYVENSFFLAHFGLSVAYTDLQISGGNGEGGGDRDPEIRGGAWTLKFFFRPFGP